VQANRRLAASFATDGTTHTLSSVSLLLANPTAGQAEVTIHANSGLEPGAPIAVLVAPVGGYTATASIATFTTTGVALAANTTYWVVLTPVSGEFDWSWTSLNT